MKKIIFSLVLSFLLMFSNIVYSSYFSAGHYNCGDLLENKDNKYIKIFTENWALGYMTGRNYSEDKRKGDSLGATNSIGNSLLYAIMKYCRQNPLKSTTHAMEHIYNNELD